MEVMTIEEYKEWVKREGIPLTKNVCTKCGRRTDCCRFCNDIHIQPERLNERGIVRENRTIHAIV